MVYSPISIYGHTSSVWIRKLTEPLYSYLHYKYCNRDSSKSINNYCLRIFSSSLITLSYFRGIHRLYTLNMGDHLKRRYLKWSDGVHSVYV